MSTTSITAQRAATPYTPREGSIAFKVIEFLRANPDEQLDADLISAKCECDRRNVHTLLGPAVQAGLLRRAEELESGDLVYTVGRGPDGAPAGPSAAPAPAPRPPAAPARPAAARKTSTAPFYVDLATVQIDQGLPLPGARKRMDWTPLLDRLTIGDSFAVPLAARSSLSTSLAAYRTATGKALVLRALEEQIRVWRTA